MISQIANLSERLFTIFSSQAFLSMKGQANEVPLFIQTYDTAHEDDLRNMVEGLAARLRSEGKTVSRADLFDLVLDDLDDSQLLSGLIEEEASFTKAELLETLRNCSDPRTHLVPRLKQVIDLGSDLTFLTGSGRLFPFLNLSNRRCSVTRSSFSFLDDMTRMPLAVPIFNSLARFQAR
jgi:hypothetical protein